MYSGPFDRLPFPDAVPGHVVAPTPDPRVHGYAVGGDLAWNVSFLDLGWLALTGELPDEVQRAAAGVALTLLAPIHVGERPSHALVVARIAGGPEHTLPGIGGVALGQQARAEIVLARRTLAWLDGEAPPPAEAFVVAPDPEVAAAYARLAEASGAWFDPPLPTEPVLDRVTAAFVVLLRLGIRDELRLQAFAAWARLPVVLAEAAASRPGAISGYPARLPDYAYTEEP